MRAGFIGLGVMGASMATHLHEKGFEIEVYNRTVSRTEPFLNKGIKVSSSPREMGKKVDCLLICAGNGDSVKELLFGTEGAAHSLASGTVVVDHTTTSPKEAKEIGSELLKKDIYFLDAPVTGGDIGAKRGTLTIFVGGEEEILSRVRPVLSTYSAKIVHVGPISFGQRMKSINQIGAIGGVAIVSEMLAYAKNLGIDVEKCIEALQGGAAGSFALDLYGSKIAANDFRPGFSVRHSLKDLRIVMSEAEASSTDLRLVPTILSELEEAAKLGWLSEGNHSIHRIISGEK